LRVRDAMFPLLSYEALSLNRPAACVPEANTAEVSRERLS